MYGGKYIDWNMLIGFVSAFTQEQGGPIRRLVANEDSQHMKSTPASFANGPLMKAYRHGYRKGNTVEFHALLRNSVAFPATEPRDKISALQGLTEAANSLPIDYELGVEEVLINTARYFLKRPEAIEVLQYAGIGGSQESERKNIPSWVVDWSRTTPINTSQLSVSRFEDWYLFRAAVEREPQIREMGNSAIELSGVHFDNVKVRGKTLPNPPEYGLQNIQEENDKCML
jgi:hypothetical protein